MNSRREIIKHCRVRVCYGLCKRTNKVVRAPRGEDNKKGAHLHFIFYLGNIILVIIFNLLVILIAFASFQNFLLPFLLVIL